MGTALGWVKTTAAGVAQRAGYTGGSVSMEVSPELLGVGYIIGPKVASITFAGGVLSYLILIPLITFPGMLGDSPFSRFLQESNLWGLGFFTGLTVLPLLTGLRGESGAQARPAK